MAYEDYIPGQNQRGPAPGQELAGAISGLGKLFGLDPEQAARIRANNTTIQRDAEKEKRVKRYGELMSKYALGGGKGLTPEEVAEATDHRVWLTQGGIGATETDHLTGMTTDPVSGMSAAWTEKKRIEDDKKAAKLAADEETKARRDALAAQTAANRTIAAQGKEDRYASAAAEKEYLKYSNPYSNMPALLDARAVDNFVSSTNLRGNLDVLPYNDPDPAAPVPAEGVPRRTLIQTRKLLQASVDDLIKNNGGKEPEPGQPSFERYAAAKILLDDHIERYPMFKLKSGFLDGDMAKAGYSDAEHSPALLTNFKDSGKLNSAIKAIAKNIRTKYPISSAEATKLATNIVTHHLGSQGYASDEIAVAGDQDQVEEKLNKGEYRKADGGIPSKIHIKVRYKLADGSYGVRYKTVDPTDYPGYSD